MSVDSPPSVDDRYIPGAPAPVPTQQPLRKPAPMAAGFVLVAGILHLLLVGTHLSHARGAGLFFLTLGAAQVVWAFMYMRTPSELRARFGFIALIVAPLVLYVLTRILRAPWSIGPEAVDVIGFATQMMQIAAGVALWLTWHPVLPGGRARQAIGLGILLAVGSYSGAIAAENVDWLAEGEEEHAHGAEQLHGHDGHGSSTGQFGTRGESIVGTVQYFGPPDGAAISAHCKSIGQDNDGCWVHHLTNLLNAEGSVVAFDALVELLDANAKANFRGHELAHKVGHHAYFAYGLDIALTLGECSYEVFQGCIHGALQMYFDDLAQQGKEIDESTLRSVCSAAESSFETYTCLHGVGHGIMMHTNYALHESLDTCYLLEGSFAQKSCYGGVVMENVVAFKDSLDPNHEPHNHGHDEPPTFWVKEEDPAYPCNVVKERYKDSCWRMQTSLILHFNDNDFEDASRVCDQAGDHHLACYASLGRDAAPRADRDPMRMSQMCSYGNEEQQNACVEAFTAGVILNANRPAAGLELCSGLPEAHQKPCYLKTGIQARSMLSSVEATALCEQAPEPFVAVCLNGRQ